MPAPSSPADNFVHRVRIVLPIALVALAGLVYSLTINPSFRWSIFEERDFLAAGQVLAEHRFPVLGPQLLAGGNTPGGALYLMLAPLRILSDDPVAFSWFARALYVFAPIAVFFASRVVAGPGAALAGAILFAASSVTIAYAYWPIHPAMSVPLNATFLAAVLYGFSRQDWRWMLIAGLLVVLLTQLHISYWLTAGVFLCLATMYTGHRKRDILIGTGAIFVVFYGPYLLSEVASGFPNTRLMISHPRFHPTYVPFSPLESPWLPSASFQWLQGAWPRLPKRFPFNPAHVLFMAGVVGVASEAFRSPNGEREKELQRSAVALFLLVAVPFSFLALSGSGYDYRHTITFAPGLFVLCAVGCRFLFVRTTPYLRVGLPVLVAILMIGWAGTLINRDEILKRTRAAGEWAVDYEERKSIAQFLIADLRVAPEDYARKVYWWWMGWSMASEVYEQEARRLGADSMPPLSLLQGSTFLLITDHPLPFSRRFSLTPLRAFPQLTVFLATPKRQSGMAIGSSNPGGGTTLSPLLREIEYLRVPDGISRVEPASAGAWKDGYLISLHHGRIKLLLRTRRVGGRDIAWRLDSPDLSGYYQEIKTLWKPTFLLSTGSGGTSVNTLYDGAFGNLFFKTPQSGVLHCPTSTPDCAVSLAIQGYFDQSDMSEPSLQPLVWHLATARDTEIRLRAH